MDSQPATTPDAASVAEGNESTKTASTEPAKDATPSADKTNPVRKVATKLLKGIEIGALLTLVGTFLTFAFKNLENRQRAFNEYQASTLKLHNEVMDTASARLYAARQVIREIERLNAFRKAKKEPLKDGDPTNPPSDAEILSEMKLVDASLREAMSRFDSQMAAWNTQVVSRRATLQSRFGEVFILKSFTDMEKQLGSMSTNVETQYRAWVTKREIDECALKTLRTTFHDQSFDSAFKTSEHMNRLIREGEVRRIWKEGEGRNYPIFGWK